MTAPALAPYRPHSATQRLVNRAGIALARRALRREFPGVTERHAVDQALAATDRGRP